MPRPASHSAESIVRAALPVFWRKGYSATSVDDLSRATGAARHALYLEFEGKHALFLACLAAYDELVVTPAFARVERPDATMTDVAGFMEFQITRAAADGLPGPGCLVANTMTEVAPHDRAIWAAVQKHNKRLRDGFEQIVARALGGGARKAAPGIADAMVIAAQGLWSFSRVTSDARVLRRAASALVEAFDATIQTRML